STTRWPRPASGAARGEHGGPGPGAPPSPRSWLRRLRRSCSTPGSADARRSAGEDAPELGALDAPQGASTHAPLGHTHFERVGRQWLSVIAAEHRRAETNGVVDVEPGLVPRFERLRDRLRLPTEDRVALLVHHGAVVQDVEQLVALGRVADLRHQDL